MRVAHVEFGRYLYGGARQALCLIERLGARGVENVLVCSAGSAIGAAAAGRCEVIELPLRGDIDPGAVSRLRRALSSERPDVVHVHSRRGADVYAGLASSGAPWRAVLSRRVDNRELAVWARIKYRPYAAVIAISRAVERELVGHVGLPAERVRLIPSAVASPAASFTPAETPRAAPAETPCPAPAERRAARRALGASLGVPSDAHIAAVIGQLIPRKGHRVLLAALPEVLERHPCWHIFFFGRGPLEAKLRRDIARVGLGGRVSLAGFRPELAEWLPGIDVVLHPALKEGLGLAVLEAMHAGLPVAASAAGGLQDAIEDGVSGRLVPPRDTRAWARVLEQLLADPAERARLGAAARLRVEKSFNADLMVARHLELYADVLAARPRSTNGGAV